MGDRERERSVVNCLTKEVAGTQEVYRRAVCLVVTIVTEKNFKRDLKELQPYQCSKET